MRINLGDRARDRITGLKGIVIARTEWLFGCERVTVQPEECKDGKPADLVYIDEAQCEVLDSEVIKGYGTTDGASGPAGDRPNPTRNPDPGR